MEGLPLPASINPNNFPGKLWRLVNSPCYQSVRWDACGQGLLVDQALFEYELLNAGSGNAAVPGGSGELFKTKNFTSFIRQLNLYGFRKVVTDQVGSVARTGPVLGAGDSCSPTGPLHHFHSPYFCRDRPDLLVHMKRLTSANKAKLAAGLQVNSRPPSRFQQLLTMQLSGNPPLLPSMPGGAGQPGEVGRAQRVGNWAPPP